jgi:hypothetical protein
VCRCLLHVPEHPGSPTYCLEHLIEGDYIKYNNNCGFVEGADAEDERVRDTPQAFSHFTFEYTKGQKIVVDIQGVSGCGAWARGQRLRCQQSGARSQQWRGTRRLCRHHAG